MKRNSFDAVPETSRERTSLQISINTDSHSSNVDAVQTYRIREIKESPHRAFYGRELTILHSSRLILNPEFNRCGGSHKSFWLVLSTPHYFLLSIIISSTGFFKIRSSDFLSPMRPFRSNYFIPGIKLFLMSWISKVSLGNAKQLGCGWTFLEPSWS